MFALVGSRLHPSIQLAQESARSENAGYHAVVAAACGVQVRQVGIARNYDIRTAQIGDASDIVVIRVRGHAPDYVRGRLTGDRCCPVVKLQHVLPDLLDLEVAAELRACKHLLELEEELCKNDQLKSTARTAVQNFSSRSLRRDRAGDEDGPHPADWRRSRLQACCSSTARRIA